MKKRIARAVLRSRTRFGALVLCLLGCGTDASSDGAPAPTPGAGPSAGADAGSGSSRPGGDPPATAPPGCTTLETRRKPTWVDSFFGIGIYSELTSTLDPGYEDAIGIRLRTGTGYLDEIPAYEQVAGTFDLGDPIERDYRTCRHCVFGVMDVSGDHIQHLYLAQSGTIVLESIDIDTGEALGVVRNAKLVEIEATGYYAWAGPVPNAGCLWIPELAFDTRGTPGGACKDVEDCPNTTLLQCRGGTCVE